jgi:aspartyl/glutamyl-tRNA(Asn/Gln) amidotransferase C subunit
MTLISAEEVVKIGHISHIELHTQEIEPLKHQLEQILSYASRVALVAGDASTISTKNVNVFREDVAIEADAGVVLQQAPQTEGTYFVVPIILENN